MPSTQSLDLAEGLYASLSEPLLDKDFRGVPIPPCIVAPEYVVGTATWERFPAARFSVDLTLNLERGRYDLTRLEVLDASGITTPDVHRYSVPKIASAIASKAVVIDLDAAAEMQLGQGLIEAERFFAQLDLEGNRDLAVKNGPTPPVLLLVAVTYTWAWVVGLSPNESVTLALNVPKRTATRWIAHARSRGLIAVNG